jgi:hypothetical protein
MDRIFSHAGVSRKAGQLKFRTSNRAEYVDILIKEGHSDLDILQLTEPMSKDDALAFLLSIDFANGNAEVQATLEAEATKRRLPGYEPEARKRGRKPKAVAEDDAQEIAEIEAEILAGIEEELLAAGDNTILLEDHVEEVEAEVAAA